MWVRNQRLAAQQLFMGAAAKLNFKEIINENEDNSQTMRTTATESASNSGISTATTKDSIESDKSTTFRDTRQSQIVKDRKKKRTILSKSTTSSNKPIECIDLD
jgi:hypothetical protein